MCVCAVSVTEKRVATQVPECRPQSQPLLIPWFLNWLLRWTYCFLLHIKETTHKNIQRQTASNWQKTYLWLFMCMYNMRSVRIYIYNYIYICMYNIYTVCIIPYISRIPSVYPFCGKDLRGIPRWWFQMWAPSSVRWKSAWSPARPRVIFS